MLWHRCSAHTTYILSLHILLYHNILYSSIGFISFYRIFHIFLHLQDLFVATLHIVTVKWFQKGYAGFVKIFNYYIAALFGGYKTVKAGQFMINF